MGADAVSFDTWIHILEFVLVTGIFWVTFWVLKQSKNRDGRK